MQMRWIAVLANEIPVGYTFHPSSNWQDAVRVCTRLNAGELDSIWWSERGVESISGWGVVRTEVRYVVLSCDLLIAGQERALFGDSLVSRDSSRICSEFCNVCGHEDGYIWGFGPQDTDVGAAAVGFCCAVVPTFSCNREAATRLAAKDSEWNGRCVRCGRGTYTGFNSVEHEGGGC